MHFEANKSLANMKPAEVLYFIESWENAQN